MKSISLYIFSFLIFISNTSSAQESAEFANHEALNKDAMSLQWKNFSTDKKWMVLINEMKKKGYAKITDEKNQWGITGKTKNGETVICCIFDFENSKKGKGSLVWFDCGKKSYKAYILYSGNHKTSEEALEKSIEYYVNDELILTKANSIGRCLRNRIKDQCGNTCLASGAGCLLVIPLGQYLNCLFPFCGSCIALSALTCGIRI